MRKIQNTNRTRCTISVLLNYSVVLVTLLKGMLTSLLLLKGEVGNTILNFFF